MTAALDRRTRGAVLYGVVVAVLMIAQQLAGKALRDGFFLSHYESSALPTVMMVSSILSVGAVLGAAQLFRRLAPARLVPVVFIASAAWFVGEWALSDAMPRVAAASLYIHTTSFGAVVVSGFWSVVNERFDPHTAKQVIGRIGGGATLGGLLGGVAAWQGAAFASIGTMVLGLAAVNVICAFGVMGLGRGSAQHTPPQEGAASPSVFRIMEETPYLWHLALLVAVSALGAAAFDYVFKARAAASYEAGEALVSFFALFYLGLGVATFAFQNLLATRALKLFGLTATVALMPGTVFVLGIGALAFGGLWSVVALRGGAAVVESSLYRSGYELLYTPLTPDKKRPTKTLIDVGGDKLGAAAGSGLALVVVAAFPGRAEALLLGLAICAGAVALLVTRQLHRGYVSSLADSLRSGAIAAGDIDVVDATTEQAVGATVAGIDPARLLGQLADQMGPRMDSVEQGPQAALRAALPVANIDSPLCADEIDDELRAIAALRSQQPSRVAAVLQRYQPLPATLIPHALPLLVDETLHAPVSEALRRVGPRHIGVLADALLSEQSPHALRSQIPGVLAEVTTQRSADALQRALKSSAFELRFRAAAALRKLTLRSTSLRVDPECIHDAIERASFEARLEHPTADARGAAQVSRTLRYAFLLLSTILPPDPLNLALRALADDNPARRGTGREYLENVLPPAVRDGLLHLLHGQEAARLANRPDAEILAEIADDHATGWLDLEALIQRFALTS